MKKIFILAIVGLFLLPLKSYSFGIDLYGNVGAIKFSNPDFSDIKWGVGANGGAVVKLSDLFDVDVRTGYGVVQIKPPKPDVEGTSVKLEWEKLKLIPVAVSVKINPLYFLPIINPYVILGLGSWKIEDPTSKTIQSFGGNAGVGVTLKTGCIGFDLRILYEKPDFKKKYSDITVSIGPVIFLEL